MTTFGKPITDGLAENDTGFIMDTVLAMNLINLCVPAENNNLVFQCDPVIRAHPVLLKTFEIFITDPLDANRIIRFFGLSDFSVAPLPYPFSPRYPLNAASVNVTIQPYIPTKNKVRISVEWRSADMADIWTLALGNTPQLEDNSDRVPEDLPYYRRFHGTLPGAYRDFCKSMVFVCLDLLDCYDDVSTRAQNNLRSICNRITDIPGDRTRLYMV